MRTFLINGSPDHSNGVHDSLLRILEKGLREAGSEVIRKNVYQLNINPCQSCFSCWTKTPGECIQNDDMVSVLPLVAESDLLVLATPVFVDGMTGPLKILLDRLIPLMDNVKNGGILLVSAAGFTEIDNFDPLVSHVKAAALNLGRDYIGEILVPSGWFIRRNEDDWSKLDTMVTSAGKGLVKTGKISQDISKEIASLVSREKVVEALNEYYSKYE